MNDYTEFRELVEGYLKTNYSLTPIVFENAHLEVMGNEHIELTDQGTEDNTQLEIGGSAHVITGILIVQIFTGANTGTERARQIATNIESIIRTSSLGIDFDMPTLVAVGLVEGVNLYQHNLSFPYQYFYGQIDGQC